MLNAELVSLLAAFLFYFNMNGNLYVENQEN